MGAEIVAEGAFPVPDEGNPSLSGNPSSARLRTVHALLDGYSSLSVPQLLKTLSPDFTHRVLPASLRMPTRDKQSFSLHAEGIFSVFDTFSMIPEEIYEDASQDVVVVHARMKGTLKHTKQQWDNECLMSVHLTSDGREVLEIEEFVDSSKALEMRMRHAPKNFEGEASIGLHVAGGVLLATCLLVATGTFLGTRRFM